MNNVDITKQFGQGYTLLELMIVVVVIAIFAAVAFPSYQAYSRKANMAAAQQEILKLAEQLERHKTRNFSYRNFTPTSVTLKHGAYVITVSDDTIAENLLNSSATVGQTWVIKATTSDVKNFTLLAKNSGLRCKSLKVNAVDNICGSSTCTTCESDSEAW